MSRYLKRLCDYQEKQIKGLEIALEYRTNQQRKLIRELEYLRNRETDIEYVISLAKEILK